MALYAWSTTSAAGAAVLTAAIPLSRMASELYISLAPIGSPFPPLTRSPEHDARFRPVTTVGACPALRRRYNRAMPARASKPDFAQNALRVVQEAAGQAPKTPPPAPVEESPASAAARALGALGASKGGVARAKALSKSKRAEIARRAATARWGMRRKKKGGAP